MVSRNFVFFLISLLQLGLVIDLTNTTRYYSPSEWTKLGIKHVKIRCKGRDAAPDNESVNTFVYEVMEFLSRHKLSKKYILVHCTHGHNRTGFMIVNFIMRSQAMHVTEAIRIFAQNRPPGIYKQDYIQALCTFYHEIPKNLICPSTPEWKRSSDFDLNGDAVPDEDDDGQTEALLHEHVGNELITNDDVLGDPIPYDQQDTMRLICHQLFDLTPSGRGNAQFPGSHPVSVNRDNLELLRQRYYYATWKADGTRYMMLITTYGCYLIDRNFSFRRVQMRFPVKSMNKSSDAISYKEYEQGSDAISYEEYEKGKCFHHFTLLDGEMVIDKVPLPGLKREYLLKRRYLIYDLVALNSCSVVKYPFSERQRLVANEVLQPRNTERELLEGYGKGNPIYRYDMEPFSVRRKEFSPLSTVTKLLEIFIPKLCHEADGLIFQGWDDPYVPRTHEGLIKWKFPEQNSVDFLFEVGSDDRRLLFINERGKKKLMNVDNVIFRGGEEVSSLSGKIIECFWDANAVAWVFLRIRWDKSTPNDINTYRKVMRSIDDNITKDDLQNEIAQILHLPMYADRHRQKTLV